MVIQRLIEVIEDRLGKTVGLNKIGYETVALMHDEIDEGIVPLNIISHLAEPVICDSANYTDDDGGDYYTLIVIETGEVNPYEVLLVNDKVVKEFSKGEL
ncbi:hypothetical protein [Lysinibacillus sp. G4S2]|uniref:hypothetical protein n=1 Tax=Lysinibacillus sp. G4S2 TaxID=3055859 RepID=UPI0025A0E54B|nr:hypothetical protein [Lysinibacillus sp. G4S2]MDM5251010.1 hypothetical protein [Lysinibacillus sp. G4S2]